MIYIEKDGRLSLFDRVTIIVLEIGFIYHGYSIKPIRVAVRGGLCQWSYSSSFINWLD